jgi:DNA-binding transcriptional ArsR family regulator
MRQYLRMHEDTQHRCGRFPDSEYVELAVEVFALLADATRVRIVLALRDAEELSVNHLADIVDRPSATVSQHLAKLRMARLVTTRHHGQRVFYRLANEHAVQLVSDAIFQAEHAVSSSPRHHHAQAEPTAERVAVPVESRSEAPA